MNKLFAFLSKNVIPIVVVIAFSTLIFGQVSSCGNTAKLNQQIGALKESVQNTTTEVKRLAAINAEVQEQNRVILQENAALKETSVATNVAMKEGLARIKQLQATRPDAPAECAPIVAAMQAEIDEWSSQFTLAIRDRDTWQAIAKNFNLAYNNQVTITNNMQVSMDMINNDSMLKDDVIKGLQKQLALSQVSKKLLGGGVLAILATVVIVSLIK